MEACLFKLKQFVRWETFVRGGLGGQSGGERGLGTNVERARLSPSLCGGAWHRVTAGARRLAFLAQGGVQAPRGPRACPGRPFQAPGGTPVKHGPLPCPRKPSGGAACDSGARDHVRPCPAVQSCRCGWAGSSGTFATLGPEVRTAMGRRAMLRGPAGLPAFLFGADRALLLPKCLLQGLGDTPVAEGRHTHVSAAGALTSRLQRLQLLPLTAALVTLTPSGVPTRQLLWAVLCVWVLSGHPGLYPLGAKAVPKL